MKTRLGHSAVGSDSEGPKAGALHLEDDQARTLLENYCEHGRIGVVLAHRAHTIVAVRFVKVLDKQLIVAAAGPLTLELRSAALAGVSFFDDLRIYSFLASIEGLERPENELPRLRLTLPTLITGVEGDVAISRRSFRIPLGPDAGLQIRLQLEESEVSVVPVDISLGGMLVELPEDAPPLAYRDRLIVNISDRNEHLSLRAEVRNRNGTELGLHFFEFGQEILYRPPQDYRRLVTALERRWLRKRQA